MHSIYSYIRAVKMIIQIKTPFATLLRLFEITKQLSSTPLGAHPQQNVFLYRSNFLTKKKRYRYAFHASDIPSTLHIHIGITFPFIRHHTFCSSDTITSCFLCCFHILPCNDCNNHHNSHNIRDPRREDQHQTCHNKQNTL